MAEGDPGCRLNLDIIEGGKSNLTSRLDNSNVIPFPSSKSAEVRSEWLIRVLEKMREYQQLQVVTEGRKKRRGPRLKNLLDRQINELLHEL